MRLRVLTLLIEGGKRADEPRSRPHRSSSGSRALSNDASAFQRGIATPVVKTPNVIWVESSQ
jgi:hypothetical protein